MKKYVIIIIVALLLVAGGVYWFTQPSVAPTVPTVTDNWLTFTDEAGVYTFSYPSDLGTTYLTTEEWPPLVNLLEGSTVDCAPANPPTAHAGVTEPKIINGREYCVTAQVEGAAGSTYTDYAYLTVLNKKVVKLTLTIREPQCDNYNEPQQSECKTEQANLDLDELIGKMISSLSFK
ncbi:MAG: hypothetical protein Q7T49_00670 [bacterium]|nr:hypothetical protein [bacterium]